MLRRLPALACCLALLFGAASGAEERPLADYERVDVAATKTSIYVGSVAMTIPPLARRGGVFESTYVAKVFPYFFSSENGRLHVEFSDEQLRQLERGETVEFKGRAVNDEGAERRVTGKATPADAASGKLKVRVLVSKRIELIFNTTYRFPAVKPAPAG